MVERFDPTKGTEGQYVRYSDYADLERQIAELRAAHEKAVQFAEKAEGERDRAREYGKEARIRENQAENARIHEQTLRHAAEAENARLRALPLKDEVERVLEPFADIAGEAWADENGWTVAACPNDRIRDWFGPSAFRAARSLLSRLRAGEQEGWRHGPYGYLIKPIGLNEEHWHLATEPSAYPDEEVSVPLYADQDQFPAAPKQGEAK